MSDDEGRMLPPAEARVRRRIASIAKKDTPKPFLVFDKSKPSFASSTVLRRREKIDPDHYRRYGAFMGTKVRGQVENAAAAEFLYYPKSKKIYVNEVYPLQQGKKQFGLDSMSELHKEAANKLLPRATVKNVVTKAAVSFPKAETLIGERVTGTHVQPQYKTGSVINNLQKFNLAGIRKRMSKAGKVGKAFGLGLAAYDVLKNLNKE